MTHPSSLVIDALAAGKLPAGEATVVRTHVESCARCRGDLAAAEAACAHFTREVLPRSIEKIRLRRARWWVLAPAVLIPALALIALVLWQRGTAPEVVDDDDIRIKGGLSFKVFANRRDEVIPVRDGTRLVAGDQIRFLVGSGGPGFLLVASIDGAGNPTIYYPYNGERSGPVTKDPSELPGSIVLDAAPGPERVFALVSVEPLEAARVKQALTVLGARGAAAIREAKTLDVPSASQASVVFEKVTP